MSWLLYLLLLTALVVWAPARLFDPLDPRFLVILGVVGSWRYGWGALHLLRAHLYRRRMFPQLRQRAEALFRARFGGASDPARLPHVFLVITSYRYPSETTAACYRTAVLEAMRYGGPVTIVASLVEPADRQLVKAVFRVLAPPARVRLVLVELPPRGKRAALAAALVAVSRRMPRPDDVVALMDGDTVLTPRCLRQSVPLLGLSRRIGGLTTDERPVGGGGPLARAWFRLRFARRHLYMNSLALSRRLLVMTGRFSLFPAHIATDPAFITRIREDEIHHWRLGRIPLLTGEDKSSWLFLLERGLEMVYVPDVTVLTTESLPHRRFLVGTTHLMRRWAGNMLRAGAAALALGPRRVGPFAWWCLVDQRLSMWTPVLGPLAAGAIALAIDPLFLYAYGLWVLTTRLVLTLGLATLRPGLGGLAPLLLYFDQVYGALVKQWTFFRLHRQRWTRQPITGAARDDGWTLASCWLAHGTAVLALLVAVGLLTGVLELPPALAGAFG